MKPKKYSALVGLELGRRRLTAVELRGGGGERVAARRVMQSPLSLDPLSAEPDLAARELRNLLDGAGIRVRQCVVCLPLHQLMVHTVRLPELSDEDVDPFLEIEAERAFPFPPEDLVVARSISRGADGVRCATLAAISTDRLNMLEQVLRLARLQPVSITAGSVALADRRKRASDAVLAVGDGALDLVVVENGGVTALRAIDEPAGPPRGDGAADYEEMLRDLRVTLRRLPRATRLSLAAVRTFGADGLNANLMEGLRLELKELGLTLEPAGVNGSIDFECHGAPGHAAALLAAAGTLRGEAPALEFMRPHLSRMRHLTQRWMARGLLWRVGSAAALLALATAGAFTHQNWRLQQLEGRWESIRPEVETLGALQDGIRMYRSWFDDKIESLTIFSRLTGLFPDDGTVWIRSFDIKNGNRVTCAGLARSVETMSRLYEDLLRAPGVTELQLPQWHGENPVQFSLSYVWNGSANP
jgi:hypothetical protein